MCPIRGKGVSTQAKRGKYKNRSTSIVRAGFTTGGKGRYMRKEGKGGGKKGRGRRGEGRRGREGERGYEVFECKGGWILPSTENSLVLTKMSK